MDEDQAPPELPETERPRASVVLRGTPVAPGVVLGRAHRKDYDLLRAQPQRVPLDRVEEELNRFHRSLSDSRRQLEELKERLRGKVPEDHARILDTHVAYLRDSVFLSDVENLILNEQMSLQAAIGKVVADFDRIFRLVESETLRERAVDLRDVGLRVLRNLEGAHEPDEPSPEPTGDYLLVARELSIVDMFNLGGGEVRGIVTQEGGLTSHAAILARSMRIPTVTGVAGLLEKVGEGDFLIIDAAEGTIRVHPDEIVRAQYLEAAREPSPAQDGRAPAGPRQTSDGVDVELSAVCGNLPEVEQAVGLGLAGIGLYRTELLYLIERERPSVDTLAAHYRAVVECAAGSPVTFRLLDASSSLDVAWLHEEREQNPALGQAGVRALLSREQVLREQLQAILVAAAGAQAAIAVPFVTDCGDMRRVKEVLFEERYALRREGAPFLDPVPLGAIVETAAAALSARDLAAESDFLVVSLDGLQQHLLAADRENRELRHYFDSLHPVVLRVLRGIVRTCEETGKPLLVFGVTAGRAANLPFLIGAGVRRLGVAPVGCAELVDGLRQVDSRRALSETELYCKAPCQAETLTLVDPYRHGFV